MRPRSLWLLGLGLLSAAGCDPTATETPAPSDPGSAASPLGDAEARPPGKRRPDSRTSFAGPALSDEDLGKKAVDELLGLAEESFDPEEQIKILDAVLKKEPKNIRALTMAMAITQAEGQAIMQRDRAACLPKFKLSAEYARRLVDAKASNLSPQAAETLKTALYNGACAAALGGEKDEGIALLSAALDAGFSEPILETDTDLDPLREMPEFAELMERVKAGKPTAVAASIDSFESFPFDFKITDVEGKSLSKADLKGKVAIVDVWGTWCPPCVAEIPHFVALQNEYRDEGFEIVGLNYEYGEEGEETVKKIREFMEANHMNYRCGLVDQDTLETIPDFGAYPTTLFLDREGKVRMKLVGAQSKEVLESIDKTLLAEEKPAKAPGE